MTDSWQRIVNRAQQIVDDAAVGINGPSVTGLAKEVIRTGKKEGVVPEDSSVQIKFIQDGELKNPNAPTVGELNNAQGWTVPIWKLAAGGFTDAKVRWGAPVVGINPTDFDAKTPEQLLALKKHLESLGGVLVGSPHGWGAAVDVDSDSIKSALAKLNEKEETNMAEVNVEDVWEVYPDLKPADTEDGDYCAEEAWANQLAVAAEFKRGQAALDGLVKRSDT